MDGGAVTLAVKESYPNFGLLMEMSMATVFEFLLFVLNILWFVVTVAIFLGILASPVWIWMLMAEAVRLRRQRAAYGMATHVTSGPISAKPLVRQPEPPVPQPVVESSFDSSEVTEWGPMGVAGDEEEDLWGHVLCITLNDAAKAERLLALELRRCPGASRQEGLKRVIDRWVQDNR